MPSSLDFARNRFRIGNRFTYVNAEGDSYVLTIDEIFPDGKTRFRMDGFEDCYFTDIRTALELIATGVWA